MEEGREEGEGVESSDNREASWDGRPQRGASEATKGFREKEERLSVQVNEMLSNQTKEGVYRI